MIAPAALRSHVARALGVAASALGGSYAVYRASGPQNPIQSANQISIEPAFFPGPSGNFKNLPGYGQALRQGVLDPTALAVGDYLVGEAGTFFLAAVMLPIPPLAVICNRVLSLFRPAAPQAAGANAYSSVSTPAATALLTLWPASILIGGASDRSKPTLPADPRLSGFFALLPTPAAIASLALAPGDIASDDQGRAYVVGTAEQSVLGWRLNLKQAIA